MQPQAFRQHFLDQGARALKVRVATGSLGNVDCMRKISVHADQIRIAIVGRLAFDP